MWTGIILRFIYVPAPNTTDRLCNASPSSQFSPILCILSNLPPPPPFAPSPPTHTFPIAFSAATPVSPRRISASTPLPSPHRHSLSHFLSSVFTIFSQLSRSRLLLVRILVSDLFRICMGISKTEINLRRLLAAAPQQQNQSKLVHYVATLREQLEQLAEERTLEGLPRISKAMLSDYSEKIEAIASKLVNHVIDTQEPEEFEKNFVKENSSEIEEKKQLLLSSGLRRRPVPASSTEDKLREPADPDHTSPVKLDAAAHAHIEKHRKLQEDLTDEMVVLAKQLKESSLMMSQSLQNTEKILDSTEKAIEHSLASTGHANVRATAIYSESSKTSCFTWLAMFVMTCVFVMVILLIRIT
ncbi:hypothetical protein VNO78_22979 [Psophocarpus tetragonolobus]|uniref:Membrane fusion protein Use1 n=1 Tax=Psophocarpus tetragonolobus TaxID=3891 RepID=A0AAN9XD27_PSOTE